MSMLSAQSDELRTLAGELRQIYEHNTDWMHDEAVTLESSVYSMREAADTIENLRYRLQESERHNQINLEVIGEMYHPEIVDLMQECHATQANYEHCKYSANRGWRDTSRYSELFGTPERAARIVFALNTCRVVGCADCAAHQLCMPYSEFVHDDYDALLEWLREEGETE